jgi:Domain of unknown function (DUF4249)
MNTRLKTFIYLILLSSCVTPFDVDTVKIVGQIVITGKITNLRDQDPILIQSTSTSGVRPPLTKAIVKVVEDGINEIVLIEESPGMYFFPPLLIGKQGSTYELRVTLSDGRTYKSKSQKLPEANGIGKSTYQITNKGIVDSEGTIRETPFAKVISNVSLEKKGLYMKWDVFETYYLTPTDFPDIFNEVPFPCFVTSTVGRQNIKLFDGTSSQGTTFNNFEIAEREIDKTFAEKHMFSVYQTSLTFDAFEYWRKVQLLLNQAGSIFDTPPAPIEGNIFNEQNPKEIVLGFFEASNITINRFSVFPSNIPFYINTQPCRYDPAKPFEFYTKECVDCLSLPNSTNKQPEWFVD